MLLIRVNILGHHFLTNVFEDGKTSQKTCEKYREVNPYDLHLRPSHISVRLTLFFFSISKDVDVWIQLSCTLTVKYVCFWYLMETVREEI